PPASRGMAQPGKARLRRTKPADDASIQRRSPQIAERLGGGCGCFPHRSEKKERGRGNAKKARDPSQPHGSSAVAKPTRHAITTAAERITATLNTTLMSSRVSRCQIYAQAPSPARRGPRGARRE